MNAVLTEEEILRYSRNMVLGEIGIAGQERLKRSRAFVAGAGGLGAPVLLYLAAAGVGEIGVADDDIVELGNLQRQIIYRTSDVGRSKVEAARDAVAALNPNCRVNPHHTRLNAANIREIVTGYDIVLDASDNFPTRFLLADFCWLAKVPLVSASAIAFYGQLQVILAGPDNPCHRCLFPEVPPPSQSCRDGGILGAVAGVMGCLQAAEAIKMLLGRESEWSGQLLNFDALRGGFVIIKRAKDETCPLCGMTPRITSVSESLAAPCQSGESGEGGSK